jgi:plasmid stabilization system protein ParE
MALTIITKKRFESKVKKVIEYLVLHWYDEVADEFKRKLIKKMLLLTERHYIGKRVNKLPGVRTTLITRHNRIYYRVEKHSIIFIDMLDTRMNPKKNPFNKTK